MQAIEFETIPINRVIHIPDDVPDNVFMRVVLMWEQSNASISINTTNKLCNLHGILQDNLASKILPNTVRIGIAKGLFDIPDNIDVHNVEIAQLFLDKNVNDDLS